MTHWFLFSIAFVWETVRMAVMRPFIPTGPYCYHHCDRGRGLPCRWWSMIEVTDEHGTGPSGYCSYLKVEDCVMLYDQCKICGVRDEFDDPILVQISPETLDQL